MPARARLKPKSVGQAVVCDRPLPRQVGRQRGPIDDAHKPRIDEAADILDDRFRRVQKGVQRERLANDGFSIDSPWSGTLLGPDDGAGPQQRHEQNE